MNVIATNCFTSSSVHAISPVHMDDDLNAIDFPHGGSSADEKPHHTKGGRKVGSRNKDKLQLQKRIQDHGRVIFARLLHWIRCNDGPVSLAAIKLALAYGYGKPPDRLLIGNDRGKPFVVATPHPVETFEDWELLVKEAESIAAGEHASHS